jgi:ABC-type multidrug transport system ATPase subunit
MIQFNQVTFNFPQKKIFTDLSFRFEKGDFIWIQGRNGSGKTTLLRLTIDLLRPQTGTIQRNHEVKTGWMPATDGSFFPRLTGQENLNFFSAISDHEMDIPGFLLDTDYGREILRTPFYKMSSGMKQMLLLARAELANPELLILDEPFRSLDNNNRAILSEVLLKKHQSGRTIIFTSHEDALPTSAPVKKWEIKNHALS